MHHEPLSDSLPGDNVDFDVKYCVAMQLSDSKKWLTNGAEATAQVIILNQSG